MPTFADECRQASRDLRRLPSDVKKELRGQMRTAVADPLADQIRSAATGPWARALSGGVKTKADVQPRIIIGGARKVVSGGANVRQLVYGSEFGGGKRPTTQQFRRRHPFIFPTVGRNTATMLEGFASVVDDVLNRFTRG